MRKELIGLMAIAILTIGCQKKEAKQWSHPNFAYNATIYELNTRQFTDEGTFLAAEKELPALKALGVDILWVMPIQPIGEITRKGSLGSYYSIRDYCAFNPEFGGREDFTHFLNKAHELGMVVILDWVANHTAPDHAWTKNEGWHYRDSAGKLMVQYDWTDIAKLNYENADMRKAMLEAMHWWMDTIGIDGFRCDVAGEVPTDFWIWAMEDLQQTYPNIFTLAENEDKADSLCLNAFDAYYGWELHHLMNEVAQGKKGVNDLWHYFEKVDTTLTNEAIRMNFTSNHDENSWAGTEYERMGDAAYTMAAFTYFVPGMPLIYTGQEYGNNHRLAFFEKDCIDRYHGEEFALYRQLNNLRQENTSLWAPEKGGKMQRIEENNEHIFAAVRTIEREGDKNVAIGIFNMSCEEQVADLHTQGLEGNYIGWDGKPMQVDSTIHITLKPWEWTIVVK